MHAEPLFIDPYAACFLPPYTKKELDIHEQQQHYCLATKFIDDKLLDIAKRIDGLKQVPFTYFDCQEFHFKFSLELYGGS